MFEAISGKVHHNRAILSLVICVLFFVIPSIGTRLDGIDTSKRLLQSIDALPTVVDTPVVNDPTMADTAVVTDPTMDDTAVVTDPTTTDTAVVTDTTMADTDGEFTTTTVEAPAGGPFSCFPSEATVDVEGTMVQMQDLKKGQLVKVATSTAEMKYEPVIYFLYQDVNKALPYVAITHEFGVIMISKKHLMYVKEATATEFVYITAEKVKAGMILQYFNDQNEILESEVTSIAEEGALGIYSPMTQSGTVVVDGVHASCYTELPVIQYLGRHQQGFFNVVFKPVTWLFGLILQATSISDVFTGSADQLNEITNSFDASAAHNNAAVLSTEGETVTMSGQEPSTDVNVTTLQDPLMPNVEITNNEAEGISSDVTI